MSTPVTREQSLLTPTRRSRHEEILRCYPCYKRYPPIMTQKTQ
ncbi:hypothetical protein CIW50_27880 [Tardiphaga sp. P9-11]|nr:hypothetical protein CIW50_27880 [Tardiphaga sp. P9-11]